MVIFSVLAAGFVMNLMAILWVVCAVLLILVVLIQKGKGGGLSGTLAGGMASGLLGSKTGDFLTWFTIGTAVVFIMLSVVLAKFYRPGIGKYTEEQTVQQTQPAPAQDVNIPLPAADTNAAAGKEANAPVIDINSLLKDVNVGKTAGGQAKGDVNSIPKQ